MCELEKIKQEAEQLKQDKIELIKLVEYLAEKPFMDCFNYLCDSRNECQTFGCKVQKRIKELKKEVNY